MDANVYSSVPAHAGDARCTDTQPRMRSAVPIQPFKLRS